MKSLHIYFAIFLVALLSSCELKRVIDPNRPSVDGFLENASRVELNNLAKGTEAHMRVGYDVFLKSVAVIGREAYLFDADPRNVQDLLGANGTRLDNNTFYLTSPYNNAYRTIKNANLLIEAADRSSLVNASEKNGYKGFARTVKAHCLLIVLNMLHENGIRVDVANPTALGPFLTREAALTAIRNLLNEAVVDLDAAGEAFPFSLSSGYNGFNTPATFKQINRALAARVAVYQQRWADVPALLAASFYTVGGDLQAGPRFVFSTAPNDFLNPMFYGEASDNIYVHPSFLTDATVGDTRVTNKTRLRPGGSRDVDGLTGTHIQNLYPTNTTPIPFIRNEELALIDAEVKIQTGDLPGAVTILNTIRSAAGLAAYSGTVDQAALIDELLRQRRYSLWLEGHRMIDLRRYNRLNAANVPIDRPGDIVHQQFPIPLNE